MSDTRLNATCAGVAAVLIACSTDRATYTPTAPALARAASVSSMYWTPRSPLSSGRTQMSLGVVNGRIYVAGGSPFFTNSAAVYSPADDAWNPIAPALQGRAFRGTNVTGLGTRLYAVAGNGPGFCTAFHEAYDATTGRWTELARTPRPRCHGVAIAFNGRIWHLGGTNTAGSARYPEVDVYDPATDQWSTPTLLPGWRQDFSAAVLNGKLYVVGGFMAGVESCTGTGASYDPVTSHWSAIASMPRGRCFAGAAAAEGRIYVVGGLDQSGAPLASVESYDPATDSWRSEPAMSVPRTSPGVVALDGLVYAIGGNQDNTIHSSVEVLSAAKPNAPPLANAGPDQTLQCVGGSATALLDGSASTDADGAISAYAWDDADTVFATAATARRIVGLGSRDLRLTVTDDAGASASDLVRVHVVDREAPSITVTQHHARLWPVDHRLVHVATISASDGCDGQPGVSIAVSSSEAVNGPGDGDTSPDWDVRTNTLGAAEVHLRAERSGTGDGRTYTVTATSMDRSMNATTRHVIVVVPKSNR